MASPHAHLHRGARRLLAVFALAALIAAAGAPSARAFGTVWGILGQHSEHERVTRLALQCGDTVQPPECFQPVSLDNLAGKRGTFGAVGAPDDIPIHLHRDREYWHCDNTDWVDWRTHDLDGEYPQRRDRAIRVLRACVEWGKSKLYDGGRNLWSFPTATPETGAVATARQLIKRDGRVDDSNPGVGLFSPSCTFNGTESSRAKCNVLEPFGYVLHMAEDFYSHTNWADRHDPLRRLSLTNPVGLGNRGIAPFLDLRKRWFTDDEVPEQFTGSCYPKKQCAGRVIHGESARDLGLNKDKGMIDLATGRVTEPKTPRGRIVVDDVSNVRRAVDGAVLEARRQWAVLRAELVQRYGPDDAAKMTCALVLDRAEACDQRNVLLLLDTGLPRRRAGERRGRVIVRAAARTGRGSAAHAPASATGRRLLERLAATDRVAVVTFDSETGEQDVDPFVAPARADVDDAATGDPEPDPPLDGPLRARDPGEDPTITPEPDPAAPGHTPEDGYTHGSEEAGETHDEPATPVGADGPAAAAAAASPVAAQAAQRAAAAAAADAASSPAAAALVSAHKLLERAGPPRGQRGVVLVTHRIGHPAALARRIDALGRAGAVVSLAVHGSDAVPRRVLAALQRTGGTATATHDAAELRRFAGAADAAGLTRLDDALPGRKATLHVAGPALLGMTSAGRDLHHVERLRRPARLRVRVLDGPLTVVATDVAHGRTTRARATRRRAAVVSLPRGGNYEITIAGPGGRRYEATLR